jgi:hypothetical protein
MNPWMGVWSAALETAAGTNPRLLVPDTAP